VIRVLEGLLANNDYFAGNEMSIADFSILPSVAIATVCKLSIFNSNLKKYYLYSQKLGLNWSQFSHLEEWFNRMQHIAGYETVKECVELISGYIKNISGECIL
jgi:glutathione S-transferase